MSGFRLTGYYVLTMKLDSEVLRRYAETESEDAFAELVRRHLGLVYAAALRQVNGYTHLAQDVAQTVFTELARKAAALSRRQVLTGWLYTCTHFAASKAVRTERRRHTYEQEAQAMHEILHTPAPDFEWEKLRPVLDNVMHDLKESDRDAILMRYFENRQLAEIGERLGLSEDGARKRVDRALEKLRTILSKRGITTTGALAATLSANAVQLAPAGLATTITSTSLAGAAAGTGATVALLKLMTTTKLQVGIISAVIVAGAATPLVIHHQAELREENQSLRQQMDRLTEVRAENERLSNLVAQANSPQALPKDQFRDLLRLRGEVGILRGQTSELARLEAENQRLRSALATASAKPKTGEQTNEPLVNLPKESWVFAGYADPESTIQSVQWAFNQGDLNTFLRSLTPDGEEMRRWQGKITINGIERDMTDNFATRAKLEFDQVTAFQITDKKIISDDEAILTVVNDRLNESGELVHDRQRFKLRHVGNDWLIAGGAAGAGTE